MRTHIEIDDALMAEAMVASDAGTQGEAVEAGLKALVRLYRQASLRALRGKVEWVGDLDEMRRD